MADNKYTFRLLSQITAIDKLIASYRKRLIIFASNTCYTNCASYNTTVAQMNSLGRLLEERSNLIYLRNSIVDSVNAMPKASRQVLLMAEVKRYDKVKIAKYLGCSTRTLYRRIVSAKLRYARLFDNKIDQQWLVENIQPLFDIKYVCPIAS